MGDQRPMNSLPQTVITTDGACRGNPGPGGWASIIVRQRIDGNELVIRLSGGELDTTNNRMELIAVINAFASLQGEMSALITVQSDSEYVIKGMTEWKPAWIKRDWRTAGRKSVKNRDLWETLNDLTAGRNIQWAWVRGHSGDPRNEEADRLANQAIVAVLAKAA